MSFFSVRNGATELLLIRHADASPDVSREDLRLTHGDYPLTERGRRQAAQLAERLATRGITAIYCSGLKRSRETADAIGAAIHLPVESDDRLREIEIAGVENLGLHEIGEIAIARGGWSHMPGTEPSVSVRARMAEAIDDIVMHHGGGRVAIVSHAGAINAYFASLLGLQHDFFFPAGNTSISTVRMRDGRRLIVTLNDTAHLERQGVSTHAAT